MTDIRDNSIEAAARAMCDDELWPGAWIKTNEVEHEAWLRRARAAIAAYEAALWQPIETAPTDETPVLVWDGRTVSEDIYAPSVRGRRGAKEGHRISVTKWRHMPPPPGGEG